MAASFLVPLVALALLAASDARAACPNLKLERVDFKNNLPVIVDHRNNVKGASPLKIQDAGEKNEVEYQVSTTAGNTKNWPVMYVRQTTIKLVAQFGLETNAREFLELNQEGNVTLIGEGTVAGTAISFTKVLTPAEITAQLAAHNTYLTTGEVTASVALPNKVIYEAATFTWKWKAKERGQAGPFERTIGTSTHNFYLTYAQPRAGTGYQVENYLTLLDLDTQGIQSEATTQPPSEAEVIKGVWSQFKTLKIGIRWYGVETGTLNRGGYVLEYYRNESTAGQTLQTIIANSLGCPLYGVSGLLETGQGQCFVWAQALSYALAIEGVTSQVLSVKAQYGTEPCETRGVCEILVKNWEFVGAGKGGNFPYEATEIKDLAGIPGQGVQNPPAFFNQHFIVEAKKGSNTLYDPSYGTGPYEGAERLKAYQQSSIAGFCLPVQQNQTKCAKATPGAQQLETNGYESYE
jgi:hypothetical protein